MKMLKVKAIVQWMVLMKRRKIIMILINKVTAQMNQMMMMNHLLIWMTTMIVLCIKISLKKEMMLKRIEMLSKKEDNTMIL